MPKLGLVMFGSGTYENHRELNNRRFTNSAKEFVKLISDPKIIVDGHPEVLDLYNERLLPNETQIKVTDFVSKDYDNVIVYYCGHGDASRDPNDYRVFLRQSNRERRHATLLHIVGLIRDIQRIQARKRIYFVLDSCYSGSAISDMSEDMDAGGAEVLIDRSLSQVVAQSGMAVFAASGSQEAARVKHEDKLTLFTGAFVRCLREGILHKSDLAELSWLDIKDEIIRMTRDRLGPDAPIPKLTSFSEKHGDITRIPFFRNVAHVPRVGGADRNWISLDERTSEHLYWRGISDESPAYVLEDFLTRFPNGTFVAPARSFLIRQLGNLDEMGLEEHLFEHPKTRLKQQIDQRLAVLKWDRLQTGTDIAELEKYIERFPGNDICRKVQDRIDFLRAPPLQDDTSIGTPEEPANQIPPSVPEAMSDIVEQAVPKPDDPVFAGGVSGERSWIRKFTRPRTILIALVLAGMVAAALAALQEFSRGSVEIEEANKRLIVAEAAATARQRKESDSKQLAAVANDVTSLSAFVEKCRKASCAVSDEANARLASAQAAESARQRKESDSKELATVPKDVASLSAFVDKCRKAACLVLDEANGQLTAAQAAETARLRKEADSKALAAVPNDVASLSAFADKCRKAACLVLDEANSRLTAAQAAATARQRKEADSKALAAVPNDVASLSAFVEKCRKAACVVLDEANSRLTAAQGAETARQRAEADSKELAAVPNDVASLRAFVEKCRKASCVVLDDAYDRLATAQAAETERVRREADSRELAAIPNDVGSLNAFVGRCMITSCSVLKEANGRLATAQGLAEADRLAKAEEVARNSKSPVGFNAFSNYDIDKNDLNMIFNTSLANCNAKCLASNECVAFVFDKWNSACYLKKQLGPLVQEPRSNTFVRTDLRPFFASTTSHMCPYNDSSMRGDVAKSFSAQSTEVCRKDCEAETSCIAYMFRKGDRQCSFFSSVSDRTKKDPTSDSGERTQNPC